MILLSLSIATSVIVLLIVSAVLFKDPKRFSYISFSLGLLTSMGSILGDVMALFKPDELEFWKKAVFISEYFMVLSWLLFALSFTRAHFTKTIGKFSKLLLFLSPALLIFVLVFPQNAFYYSPEFESEKVLFLGNAGYFFNLFLLLYMIVAIVHLESVLRSSSGLSRWQIKYMVLGVGGILGLNIFYYSHALLYRSIDMSLLPVRAGGFLLLNLLLGFSIMRHKFMDVEVAVSRGVFYKSLSLFIVGFYLLSLGIIGEGMKYFSPEVGRNITTFLGFAGAMGILVVLLSEQLRKKVMVFINKNFYSQKYDYRAQWLRFTQRVSSKHSFDELLISIVEGFKDALGVRGASLWLREKGNGEYYCAKTVDAVTGKEMPGKKLINFLENKRWIFNINDKKCSTVASENSNFMEKNGVSLIVPLIHINKLIGFVVLREGLAGNDYNYEDYDLLKTLAGQATFAIINAQMSEELIEAREMQAVGKLSSFILHDLKNAASMLTLVAQNAGEHMDNPEFQKDTIRSVINTSEKIKNLMEKLKNLPHKIHMNFLYADLGVAVREVIDEVNLNGKSKLEFSEIEPVKTVFDREEIKKVVLNLVINAIDATKEKGEVLVKIGRQDNMGFINVSDSGNGISREFMETRLFKPFQTTKKKGLGVGLYQCKTVVEAHSGKLTVKSTEGSGTEFNVYLPIVTEREDSGGLSMYK